MKQERRSSFQKLERQQRRCGKTNTILNLCWKLLMKGYSRATNLITTATKYKPVEREISVLMCWHPREVMCISTSSTHKLFRVG